MYRSLSIKFRELICLKKMVPRNENAPKSLTFAYSFRPIYYYARVCGLMPFSITSSANSAIFGAKFQKRDFIWLAISMCIHIFFIYIVIQPFKSLESIDPDRIVVVLYNLSIFLLSLLFGFVYMIWDACNRFKFVKIFNEITIFDNEVCK